MREFLDDHFNTLLVTALICGFAVLTLHIIHHGTDAGSLQWVENITGQFVSALLTLLVGRKIVTNGNGNGNGDGKESPPALPNPPVPPVTR